MNLRLKSTRKSNLTIIAIVALMTICFAVFQATNSTASTIVSKAVGPYAKSNYLTEEIIAYFPGYICIFSRQGLSRWNSGAHKQPVIISMKRFLLCTAG